ncbi:MAG TPA: hypothetical protein VGN08_04445 [Solirubrobacteraceae bacterium]
MSDRTPRNPGASSAGPGERAVIDRLHQLREVLPELAYDAAVARREAVRLRRENAKLQQRLSNAESKRPPAQ